MELCTLTTENVALIHWNLVEEFARSGDPITPPGVKSVDMLESAISRQFTSFRGFLKYQDPVDNAASLTFGLCNNHPFHNGNKRTALVSMLVHLDKNKLSLKNTRQNDLYKMMLDVATHTLGIRHDPRKHNLKNIRRSSDDEVRAISNWLRPKIFKISRGEKPIKYRDLKSILKKFDISLEHPFGNKIDLIKREYKKDFLGRIKIINVHIGTIGYPGDNVVMNVSGVKNVRKICRLTEADGCDSSAFYNDEIIIDSFINYYRTILRRLSNK